MAEIKANNILTEQLRKSQIAGDLLNEIRTKQEDVATGAVPGPGPRGSLLRVIIEGNASIPGGATRARNLLASLYLERLDRAASAQYAFSQPDGSLQAVELSTVLLGFPPPKLQGDVTFAPDDKLELQNSFWTDQYLFGNLTEETINSLAKVTLVSGETKIPLVHKFWLNHQLSRFVYESGKTVKCDAARAAFAAAGKGVIWAVADTGIDRSHYHFKTHGTLDLPDGLRHMDFTTPNGDALSDLDGHGSHVAGIIAGETVRRHVGSVDMTMPESLVVQRKVRKSDTAIVEEDDEKQAEISGIAPLCKLVSLKVLESGESGDVGTLLAALGYIQKVNSNGRTLRIHGVNLSLGYTFDARWFAAGQSPLCVEVDRLVRNGVVVVVAAGNSGYGTVQSLDRTVERASHLATISDPGNADLAITVGSTHRDSPHTYGVSYFSAKGPTADGRMKPDLVAPGERIVSVRRMDAGRPGAALFQEDTGTSMAAPHVSGAIAAFLSVRREFQGQPQRVKQIFCDSATDLRRRAEYQGAGLIDAMRALQSV